MYEKTSFPSFPISLSLSSMIQPIDTTWSTAEEYSFICNIFFSLFRLYLILVLNKWVLVGNWIASSLGFLACNSPFFSTADIKMNIYCDHDDDDDDLQHYGIFFNCWKNSENFLCSSSPRRVSAERWVGDGKMNFFLQHPFRVKECVDIEFDGHESKSKCEKCEREREFLCGTF